MLFSKWLANAYVREVWEGRIVRVEAAENARHDEQKANGLERYARGIEAGGCSQWEAVKSTLNCRKKERAGLSSFTLIGS